MRGSAFRSRLALPKDWTRSIQAALVHVMALAHYAMVSTRSWAADSANARVRLTAKANTLEQEVELLREELRIKDGRLNRIPPQRRPYYAPTERLAILELRASRSWSLAQTAKIFAVTTTTIASWTKRLDEQGPAALLRTREPVNKFPDFVRYVVQRLQTLCPRLGKVKIAQILARAGLHLGATTVGRLRRQRTTPTPTPRAKPMPSARRVTADYPNHVWHVDLTTTATSAGFWTPWLPLALPQCWPFCWWLAVVLDHYSRRALGFAVFRRPPTSQQLCQFLGQLRGRLGAAPKYLVTDSGTQFSCARFRHWCRRHGIRQRLGAIGKQGSIAVVERFIGTLKQEGIRLLSLVPLRRRSFLRELTFYQVWYNGQRPHMTLAGATPDEVYFGRRPACRLPRFEPRPNWPRPSTCARPQVLVKGQPGTRLELVLDFPGRRRHLPRVTLTRAA
jgi:putative transposase